MALNGWFWITSTTEDKSSGQGPNNIAEEKNQGVSEAKTSDAVSTLNLFVCEISD